ncbi:hypothetical protein BAY61_32385 (plasmid) [Prauserella marina]|uniref:Uncharacterized protein n=1 Tax=Prauserella marina TaxID=530584 RepID=A0A222W1H6_9PSEU|nr:hypothetical protein [Prauserella marina]ASR39980.1 hypothetical protein BAY61_32385 [Prauserella marina]PWV71321.1 hypothetical protein DES30_11237 [Prauserella marina]SDD96597.1 hypothetical protein SAMN05421630_11575 [Prauserella marina]
MSALTPVLLAAAAGDIALVGSNYFRITEVREPTHPAAPGLAWHGYWWRADLGHWGSATVLPPTRRQAGAAAAHHRRDRGVRMGRAAVLYLIRLNGVPLYWMVPPGDESAADDPPAPCRTAGCDGDPDG